MLRRFRQHDLRRVTELGGMWDFAFLGDVDPDAADFSISAIEYTDVMAVPGCFDATPAYAARRGAAAYRTRIPIADGTPHRLIFDGAHHWCRVFVAGEARRDHVGGFTRFAVDLDDVGAGEVELVVLVDNRFDYDRCPIHLEYFDWYHFGGLARGAELHHLGSVWIDAVRIVTEDAAARRLALGIDYGAVAPPCRTTLTVRCAGQKLEKAVRLDETSGRIELNIELPGADLWSPNEPRLHEVYVRLGDDDMRERIGIRQVKAQGRHILINGEPVRLLGFCRHEAHPQFGCTLPEQLLVADVQQLKDMGCNFVRGGHYPQDVRFLDLCDETGICVWNESIGWGHTPEHLNDERFIRAQLANIDEMVAAAANRPSVIMWGIINEGHSHDPECRGGYETLLGRLRQLDGTRPVTYACNHPFDDVCMDLADIVSINTYPGWYGGEIEDIPAALDKIVEHFDDAGRGDKPLIISEIGGGALYGWRDWNETRWTEPYQARLLETVIRTMFAERDRFCGLSIWQFGDCRTSQEVRKALGRPRAFNNKGVVDEYRRPKLAYETVKRLFRQLREGTLRRDQASGG